MKDLVEIINDIARNYPENIAVIDGDNKISYRDFITLVNIFSANLTVNNPQPKVVFDLQQGIDAYALIVAIMNVGGTYCPLNPDAPIDMKMQIINEFIPDFIIVGSTEKTIEFNSEKAIAISYFSRSNGTNKIVSDYNGEDIVYVIYTSGSTGVPKGVKVSRKALNKFLEWSVPTYAANENDIWGQFSFLSFDLSIVDIFTCLCSGASLYAMNNIPSKKFRPSGEIEKAKITIWHSIPSAVEFMIINEKSKNHDFSSLRLLSFCGEPLKKHHVEFLFSKKKTLTIFNTYGPTEGTLFCTWQELNSENFLNFCEFTMSIGKAIPGWNLKLNAVKGIEEKEITIWGDYIGKGYLTTVADSKFKELEIDGRTENAFQTGDLINEKNGNIYFSCRIDRQVKIKGHRVELDEIDFRINEFLGKTSVTVVKKDVLYSFIETEEEVKENELREYLKIKLEPNKIPNAFYPMNEIPRNQNQKIDNNALIQLLP